MKNTLGIIFSDMHDHMVSELTQHRCMGSVPVGGRYRLIDFVLSSMANAGAEEAGVITKTNYLSLMDHLGTGREWDLSRKRGGLVILPPFGSLSSMGMYQNRVEALAGVMGYIRSTSAEYVLGADCDYVYNPDFADFIASHIKSGAEISVMYKKMEVSGEKGGDVSTFLLGQGSNVVDMLIHPKIVGEQNVYLNVFVMSKRFLERVAGDCYSRNRMSFNRDILQANVGKHDIHAYEFTGYAGRFDSMRGYYKTNMDLLGTDARRSLFPQSRPVYTKIRDTAPVRYGLDAKISNSLLGDGCIIEGEVEDCVLFRGVKVEKGAKLKGCIVMQGTQIGAGSNLEHVITDKDVTIAENRKVAGFSTYPVYISKGASV
ncbi:MAG: glucose-1-phosphate adenylyltransferase subunit GlgD [Oscillospiraceae bacterium]|nr:glucose-1-phosphate adenylyltransferase subunit GlgD [Oscillospiraceae bacterium]